MSKLVKTSIISLLVLLVIVVAAFIGVIYINEDQDNADEDPTIDEVVEYSYTTPEITTNLQDGNFVRIQFQVVTDSEEAREEIEKREFQVQNILIKELTTMEKDSFQESLSELEGDLLTEINEVMTEGKVSDVYTIDKILQ